MHENEIVIGGLSARLNFTVETVDGDEETYVEVHTGYELMEKLRLYLTKEYTKIFNDDYPYVSFAHLKGIEYSHTTNEVNVKFYISTDDSASLNLAFDTNVLQDANAKKIALFREIIDYDNESENILLHKLLNAKEIS
ncbi:hypothetical protein ABD87_22875 [Lysinibacillus sphaericus]|uniref:hypothetical protein n=1 Tax=Lysinibacillus sphaericus TaxID=1421 RepID=UPI0018CCB7EA|nr:hypothetical protein [Lysinibacillus sphaericus]MBG9732272.1 hypothetical protein [Lysinibacillus sphaericus]